MLVERIWSDGPRATWRHPCHPHGLAPPPDHQDMDLPRARPVERRLGRLLGFGRVLHLWRGLFGDLWADRLGIFVAGLLRPFDLARGGRGRGRGHGCLWPAMFVGCIGRGWLGGR
jgi:hypothetical protein